MELIIDDQGNLVETYDAQDFEESGFVLGTTGEVDSSNWVDDE